MGTVVWIVDDPKWRFCKQKSFHILGKYVAFTKRQPELSNAGHPILSFRYEVTILRDRFEQNRNLTDVAKLQKVLQESEKELHEKQHYQPIKFPYSPGGVAYGRALESPDWVLDYWQEEEKARFPEYFAQREQRKKEYITYWEKKFGKAEEPAHH